MSNEPPAAGTPPAKEGGNEPPAQQGKSQAEIDAIVEERLARDRRTREEALAKDLGMSIKDVKALIKAKKDADEAQKTEMEKLTGERDSFKNDATSARLEAVKVRALAKAGTDPEKIDALLKRVVGNTPEEIEADVKDLAALGLLAAKPPSGAQGAGNPGLQKKEEPPDLDAQIKTAHAEALKTGNWTLYNSLTLQKQGLKVG